MRHINITQTITSRESAAIESYFNEVGKIELIDSEREIELAKRIKEGDPEAVNQLVKTNLRFVISVAKKYQHMGLPLIDLISEGNLGLLKAAQRFDESRGFKFISFAVWWIREAILTALAEQTRLIRLPMNQINLLTKINRLSGELENRLERQPTSEELAEQIGVSFKHVEDCRNNTVRTTSYDEQLDSDGEHTVLDILVSDEENIEQALMEESARENIRGLLDVLNNNERRVIELSFGITEEYELMASDISRVMGLSNARVLQIRKNAMNKLRAAYFKTNAYVFFNN